MKEASEGQTEAQVTGLKQLVERDRDHECDGFGVHHVCVKVVAVATLPTRFGDFRIVAFWNNRDGKEHVAMVHGDVVGGEDVPTRLHSECLTGDALGSLRCDCRDQLETALRTRPRWSAASCSTCARRAAASGSINKMRAYALQEQGLDTVEANLALGFRDDERDYAVAAHMLQSLSVRSIQLMTNNPDKIRQLEQHGVEVSGRLPHVMPPNEHNRFYLETKATRSGHFIDLDGTARLPEQGDPVIVVGEGKG